MTVNMYIIDGSIMPANPITALAEYAMSKVSKASKEK
jgi:hypothetical protein